MCGCSRNYANTEKNYIFMLIMFLCIYFHFNFTVMKNIVKGPDEDIVQIL